MILTNKITFKVEANIPSPNTIKFQNKLGGWDVIQCTKYKQIDVKTTPATYSTALYDFTYAVDSTRKETFYTPYMANEEYDWILDLFTSPVVLINDKYYNILAANPKYDNYGDNICSFEITASPQDTNNLTR